MRFHAASSLKSMHFQLVLGQQETHFAVICIAYILYSLQRRWQDLVSGYPLPRPVSLDIRCPIQLMHTCLHSVFFYPSHALSVSQWYTHCMLNLIHWTWHASIYRLNVRHVTRVPFRKDRGRDYSGCTRRQWSHLVSLYVLLICLLVCNHIESLYLIFGPRVA